METYKNAGVDIEAGYEAVRRIKKLVRSTYNRGVIGDIGLFGGCYAVNKSQVLVSATDGVGTKLKLAFMMGRHDTIGIDLVAMNVDDIVAVGARPLFFLDYIACNKLEPGLIEKIVSGIAAGCKTSGCALIGGETAELSDMYKKDEYDLAGFAVGVVDRKKIINGKSIRPGDVVIGLQSSGLHSNGYSLARKIIFNIGKFKPQDHVKGLKKTIGEELLTPTKIYAPSILKLIDKVKVKGIAHITGGGLRENIERLLPPGCQAVIDRFSWKPQAIFQILQLYGRVATEEMFKTFNMGIGMAVVVAKKDVNKTLNLLQKSGDRSFVIGNIQKGKKEVLINSRVI
ncbi:MAG: phosphoribosylformylglycinamidine cyclo-ligase [Candidatus Margulisiibacteriota bacterium]|nr:phosphoribosylformylglycinamidine cyclo-ligase [Candidatus Margulisiibacteriota bacterium]